MVEDGQRLQYVATSIQPLTIHVNTPQSEPFLCLGISCRKERAVEVRPHPSLERTHLRDYITPALETELRLLLVSVLSRQVVS